MPEAYTWYSTLVKPAWSPPSWLFGPVWTVLYLIIFITFGLVFYKVINKKLPVLVVVPFLLNLLFNFIFTPIQFGIQNNILAAVDISLVLATLIWALVAIYPYLAIVTLANLPYLAWVLFATALQFTITYLNKG